MAEKKSNNTKAVSKKAVKTDKTVKVKKVKKQAKPVSAKKLPSLLKKSYSKKQFEKKLLKKIFIADDKTLISSLFKNDSSKEGNVKIPQDLMINAADFRKLKLIAKEVKKQKGYFNFAPLIAILIFCAVIGITVTLFKNVVVKYAMINGMQTVFQAKTDIDDVDLKIFKSSLSVSGIAQANKDKPMSNMFEIGNINVKFNLTELLRGKIDVQNIGITEVALGTQRKTSGELPVVLKSATEKKVSKQTNEKSQAKISEIKKSLYAVFDDYNPEKIISNVENNLKSPSIAKTTQEQAETLTSKWKDKPDELKNDISTFNEQAQELINKDWSKISNAVELAKALENVKSALENGKKLTESTKATLSAMQADSKTVKNLSSSLQAAIKSDQALVQTELNKITSFSMDTLKTLISDSLTAMGYEVFGKYYPYIQQGMSFAEKMKSQSKTNDKTTAKSKAKTLGRMKGQDIFYKADDVPSFLLENLTASGTGIKAQAKEFSSDPDMRGKPSTFDGSANIGKQSHVITSVIDGRSDTKNSFIDANYKGSGYQVNTDMGVLALKGSAKIDMDAISDKEGNISANGVINMSGLTLGADSFEPEFAYNLYKKALSSISTMKINVKVDYSSDNEIKIKLSSDADAQFFNSMKSLANSELGSIKNDAQKQISALLTEKTGGATSAISQYLNVESLMNNQGNNLSSITEKLNSKQTEISNQIKAQTTDKAKNASTEAASNMLKKLF